MAPQAVQLQYFEPGRPPWGLAMTLPQSFGRRPARRLVEKFFRAYADAHPAEPPVDAASYILVDVRTRGIVESAAPVASVADGAVLSVAPRRPARPELATGLDSMASASSVLDRAAAPVVSPMPTFHHAATGRVAPDEAEEDETEQEFDAYCLYIYERTNNTNKTMAYARVRHRLRAALRRRVRGEANVVDDASSTAASSDLGTLDEDEDIEALADLVAAGTGHEAYQRDNSPKDWGQINFRKALCPHVVAGRRCPRGDSCTYAHRFDELRVERPPPPPHVCEGDSTAAHVLSAPEWWQLGVFAEPGRRGPFLWKKMAAKAESLDSAKALRAAHRDYLARAREERTVRA